MLKIIREFGFHGRDALKDFFSNLRAMIYPEARRELVPVRAAVTGTKVKKYSKA